MKSESHNETFSCFVTVQKFPGAAINYEAGAGEMDTPTMGFTQMDEKNLNEIGRGKNRLLGFFDTKILLNL